MLRSAVGALAPSSLRRLRPRFRLSSWRRKSAVSAGSSKLNGEGLPVGKQPYLSANVSDGA
jgi:hypothetical protein